LQDGTYNGLSRISIFSTVSVAEAISPTTPANSIHHALAGEHTELVPKGVESCTGPSGFADAVVVTMPLGSQPSQFRERPQRSL
jgi:hypothetical protein